MFYVARPAAYSERRPRAGQARAGQGRAGQRRVIGFVEGREELSSMRGDHLETSRYRGSIAGARGLHARTPYEVVLGATRGPLRGIM